MTPKKGYILPLWEKSNSYRATAIAYMQREKRPFIENSNGKVYSLSRLQGSLVVGHSLPVSYGSISRS